MRILSLSGFVPEAICDTVRFIQYHGDRNITFYCGYASDYISQVLEDNSIDGAVFPKSCDSGRIIKSYLEDSGKFLFQIHVPSSYDDVAVGYFSEEIRRYKRAIEEHYSIELNDTADRIILLNERNSEWKKKYDSLEELNYKEYLDMIHMSLSMPLEQQTKFPEIRGGTGVNKRVYLTGSFLSNTAIAGMIEECGLKIVGDNLPESGRLAGEKLIEPDGDIYKNIADSILSGKLSPTRDDFRALIDKDIDEVRNKKVDAIIMVTQKFCEPYEYLYPVYKKAFAQMNIPVLQLVVNDSEDSGKVQLQIEAFSDMIGGR